MGWLTSLLASLSSRAADLPLTTWHGETMASPYVVKIAGASLKPADLDRLKAEVDARLREVNRQMSHYQPDSELSRFNRHEAARPFQVSAEFARVTRFALDLHRRSGGLFDPTLGPLINLWGFGPKGEIHQAPTDEQIRAALQQCGGQRLQVTERDELVKTLPLPTNMNVVATENPKGFFIVVFDAKLIFSVLESIFGGSEISAQKVEGREFTRIEVNVIKKLIDIVCTEMEKAWNPVFQMACSYSRSEMNPNYVTMVAPEEIMASLEALH